MADKEKPVVFTFNTIWVVVVFIFSLGILHANVTNGVEDNKTAVEGSNKAIKDLEIKMNIISKSIYSEVKELREGQQQSNRQDTQLRNDIEWIKKGQTEIKELIKAR